MRNLKKFLALALAMMMVFSLMITVNAADVKTDAEIAEEYQTAVNFLFELGVLKGGDDGLYKPTGTITRAEFAMMLFRFNTGVTDDSKTAVYAKYANFPDVPSYHWAVGAIGYCQEYDLMKGDDAGNFNPDDEIDGYSVLITLLRVLGYDQNGELSGVQWASQALYYASSSGMLQDLITTATLGAAATRETVAQLFFTTLTKLSLVAYDANNGSYMGQIGGGLERPIGELHFDMKVLNIVDAGQIPTNNRDATLITWLNAKKDYGFEDDPFGRPTPDRILMIKNKEVIREYKGLVAVYDTKMFANEAEKDLKDQGYSKAKSGVEVWVNGVKIPLYATALAGTNITTRTITAKDASNNNIDGGGKTVMTHLTSKNNNQVEVYVDDEGLIETVVCITTFVNKLTEADVTEPTSVARGYITLTDSWGIPSTTPAFNGSRMGNSSGSSFEPDTFDFEVGDVVIYTRGTEPNVGDQTTTGNIVIVAAEKVTEKVSGTVSQIYTDRFGVVTITVGGKDYVLCDSYDTNADTAKAYGTIEAGETANLWIVNDYVVYGEGKPVVDNSKFGMIVGASVSIKDSGFNDDAAQNRTTVTAQVKLLTSDGTITTYNLATSKVTEADCVTPGQIASAPNGEYTLSDGKTKVDKAGKFATPGNILSEASPGRTATVGDIYATIRNASGTTTYYILVASAGDIVNTGNEATSGAVLLKNIEQVPGATAGNLIFNYTVSGSTATLRQVKTPITGNDTVGNYLSKPTGAGIDKKNSTITVEATGGSANPSVTSVKAALTSDTVYVFYDATEGSVKSVTANMAMTMDIKLSDIKGVIVEATRKSDGNRYTAKYVFVSVEYDGETMSNPNYAYVTGDIRKNADGTVDYMAYSASGTQIWLNATSSYPYAGPGVYNYTSAKKFDSDKTGASGIYEKGRTSTSIKVGNAYYTIDDETFIVIVGKDAKLVDGCTVTVVENSDSRLVTTIYVTAAKV